MEQEDSNQLIPSLVPTQRCRELTGGLPDGIISENKILHSWSRKSLGSACSLQKLQKE